MRMVRVLVVDDEERITDSLAGLLEESKQFALDVCKAYSGAQALRLLDEFQVDIVVSDISMPQISGIELAGQIRRKWPSCQVIFLTGYDTFPYAQQAIRQKVTHYVLKSEGDEALLEAIGECIAAIEKNADLQSAMKKMQEENRLYQSMLRCQQIRTLFLEQERGAVSGRMPSGEPGQQNVEITLEAGRPVMLLAGRSGQEMTKEMAFAVDLAVREKIAYAVKSEVLLAEERMIVWALQPAEQDQLQHAQAVIKGMAESLCLGVEETLGISLSFLFQEKASDWTQVNAAMEALTEMAASCLEPDRGMMMAGVEYFQEKSETELEKSFASRLLVYISEHLDGDLTLCTLSEKLHLNASYLSRRFKELTGRTLTEVILEKRMEKACELLQNTSVRISEIAGLVGYETTANFSRVFKKTMKQTPREYRDEAGRLQ